MTTVDMAHVSAIRTAATWLRKSGKTLDEYPKRDQLTDRQRIEAQQFASGVLPWPRRWTLHLYSVAIS